MKVDAGDLLEHPWFADQDRHVGPSRKHVPERRRRGRRDEHGVDAVRPLQEPLDDQPAFGDEQPRPLERGGIAHEPIGVEQIGHSGIITADVLPPKGGSYRRVRSRKPEAGSWKLELEAGSWKLEAGTD